MKRVTTVIRLILSLALVYAVFKETGPFTALSALLSLLGLEITPLYIAAVGRKVKGG